MAATTLPLLLPPPHPPHTHGPPPLPSLLRKQVLDRLLSSWDVGSQTAQGAVESCLAEVEDLLSYCNDVLATGAVQCCAVLCRAVVAVPCRAMPCGGS